MIVDDNEQAREMIKRFLHEVSEEFRECDDGADAVDAYAEFLPDWVLMDWEMTQVSGLVATQNIISRFPDARILMVTNYDEEDIRKEAAKAGAIGFVPKDDLLSLRSFLRGR